MNRSCEKRNFGLYTEESLFSLLLTALALFSFLAIGVSHHFSRGSATFEIRGITANTDGRHCGKR